IRDRNVTGVQTCALPIYLGEVVERQESCDILNRLPEHFFGNKDPGKKRHTDGDESCYAVDQKLIRRECRDYKLQCQREKTDQQECDENFIQRYTIEAVPSDEYSAEKQDEYREEAHDALCADDLCRI